MNRRRVTKAHLVERVKDLETACGQMLADLALGARPEFAASGYSGRVYRLIKAGIADREPVNGALPGGTPAGFLDRLHPDDSADVFQSIQDHVEGKTASYNTKYRLLAGDNWRKYQECGMVVLRDNDDAPLLLAGDLFDITDTKSRQHWSENSLETPEMDPLTGIKSRAAMIECLEAAAARAEFLKEPLSVVMFDIDDFRSFNEALGSDAGDSALRDVARIIHMNVRETDVAGRYGGEEFLVLFPRTDSSAAAAVSERIRSEIAMNEFSLSIPITVSGGVMQYAGESLEALINGADNALRAAKAAGKNRIVVRQLLIPPMRQ